MGKETVLCRVGIYFLGLGAPSLCSPGLSNAGTAVTEQAFTSMARISVKPNVVLYTLRYAAMSTLAPSRPL